MDYGALLQRAWEIIWNNKWLLVLGLVIALSSSSGGSLPSSSGSGYQFDQEDWGEPYELPEGGYESPEEFFADPEVQRMLPWVGALAGVGVMLLIVLIAIGVVIGLAIWVVTTLASGALVYAVDLLDGGEKASIRDAVGAAWSRGWRLIGIALVPAIPVIVLFIAAGGLVLGAVNVAGGSGAAAAFSGLGIAAIALMCLTGLAALALGLLRYLAERACMLENTGVFDSYGRAWAVLRDNFGQALVLFLLEIAIRATLGLLLIAPRIFIAICCFLWPLAWLIDASLITYFSTVWTLAWRRWTRRGLPAEAGLQEAPAV